MWLGKGLTSPYEREHNKQGAQAHGVYCATVLYSVHSF